MYERSEKCVFTGYSEQFITYRLYNPVTKNFVISIDIEFKEDESWNGSAEKTMTIGVEIPYGQVFVEEEIEQVGN